MTLEIGLLLGLTVLAVIFFAFDWVSPDVTALGLVLLIVFTGLLPAKEAFQGFGSETVIMIMGLLILTAALMRTGVVDLVGSWILRYTGTQPLRLMIVVMLASAGLGAFMSNTASTAFFLPVVMGLAKKANVNPRQLLLPLAFSSILSSSITLISTSTNIVVSGLMTRYGLKPMGMFELTPVGLAIVGAGLLYMIIAGRFWLRGTKNDRSDAPRLLREYLSEVVVLPDSALVGQTLGNAKLGEAMELTVVRVVRGKANYLAPRADLEIQPRDVLLVEAAPDDLLKIKDKAGLEIKADWKLSDPLLPAEQLGLVEAIILPRSPFLGRTLKGLKVRERYGVQVLGISRHGEVLHRKLSLLTLQVGDVLLVQGARESITALEDDGAFRVIESIGERQPLRKRAPLAVGIFVLALALGTFKITPLYVAVIFGAVLAFATKCITPEEAYRELEWKAIILIGAMLALGAAMDNTGAARYLASLVIGVIGDQNPVVLLAGFFALTVALTQPMSNQAAAVVILPIAIQTATQLGLNPRSFAMMVALAASCSYLTPLEPSCLMVYGPGGYKFTDFLKVGSILTVIIGAIAVYMVPRIWPLTGF